MEILEEMKCPICFEVPEGKIFLCQNGHLLCDACSTGMKLCPQCRVSVVNVKTRNIPLERLLDTYYFDCVYVDLGCPTKITRQEITSHSINCIYSGKQLKICKQIGYRCEFSSNLLMLPAALQHFQADHGFTSRDDFYFPIRLEAFDVAARSLQSDKTLSRIIWTPVMLNLGHSSGFAADENKAKLILLSSLHGDDESVSWTCFRLDEQENEQQKFSVEFGIEAISTKAADLFWRTPVIGVEKLAVMHSESPFRIRTRELLQHYIREDGSLTVTVKLTNIRGRRTEFALHCEPSILYSVKVNKDKQTIRSKLDEQKSDDLIAGVFMMTILLSLIYIFFIKS